MKGRSAARIIPPKLDRAKETLNRILDTCTVMLEDRRFDEISVNDICNESGVSVSSIYARFSSKDAILLALIDRHAVRLQQSIDIVTEELARRRSGPLDLDAFTRLVVTELVDFTRGSHRLETAAQAYPEARQQLARVNDLPAEWVLEQVHGVVPAGEPTVRRLEFAIRAAASVVHRAIGSNVHFADRMGMDDAELIDEVTRLIVAYVRAAMEVGAGD